VTAEDTPTRCWAFPGTAPDRAIIEEFAHDLANWLLHRVNFVADAERP
jgi:hypothetical protein